MFDPRIDIEALQPLVDAMRELRQEIGVIDVAPVLAEWTRRHTEARGAHMSTRIEGNPMTELEVRETLERGHAANRSERENRDYREAARFARQLADDPTGDVDGGLIRALHFLVVRETDRYGTIAQYRTEQNQVMRNGERVYLPPSPGAVPRLMGVLVEWLRERRHDTHALILAAVAHAEFVNVHPFDDGNGRTARAFTLYLLARGGWRFRDFVSTEETFGGDVESYYGALRQFGPRYPGATVELTDWCRWFLTRFVEQARGRVRFLIGWTEERTRIAASFADLGLPARLADACAYLSLYETVTSTQYARAARISSATAVSDLNRLVEMHALRRTGAGPATRYVYARNIDDVLVDLQREAGAE